VFTAGNDQPPKKAVATGDAQIGKLNFEAIHVPTLANNLLSATQISRDLEFFQISELGKLLIQARSISSFDDKTASLYRISSTQL
jgi:hypothetical protein